MTLYTLTQIAVAKESWEFWRLLVPADFHSAALLGNEDGETSFIVHIAGDKGYAKGIFQWWPARRADILKGTGIDVATAPHLDQLKGAYWEMTQSKVYKKVWSSLVAATSLEEAVTVLVKDYERSANQSRDVARRLTLGTYWLDYAQKNWGAQ